MHSERGTLKVVSDVGARIYAQSAHEQCGKECFAVCYRVKQQENLFLVSLQAFFLLHACILTSKASSWHERVAGRDRRSVSEVPHTNKNMHRAIYTQKATCT